MTLINKSVSAVVTVALGLVLTSACVGGEVLFREVSRNYDAKGPLGIAYRREFESRMFIHSTWRERLYANPYEPDVDETLEIYSKPNGSRWLSCRHATPSFSRLISDRIWLGEKFDLKKKLATVHVTGHDIALPAELANEVEMLWRTMLPGVAKEPTSETHQLVIHPPAFIAFVREGDLVKTGRIAMAAYSTPAYREFAGIVDDLLKLCDSGADSKQTVMRQLPSKIRNLRARLAGQKE